MSSSAAPLPGPVDGWRATLDNLSPHASPCRYLVPAKWAAIRESGIEFCDRLGAEAHRLRWTAAELFAVHPEYGTARIDACGVLIIGSEAAHGVEANRVRFERTSGYRNAPGRVWGAPVWKFAKRQPSNFRDLSVNTLSSAVAEVRCQAGS